MNVIQPATSQPAADARPSPVQLGTTPVVHIVIDRVPPSAAKLGLNLTVGKAYRAEVVNPTLRLYSTVDDLGTPFSLALYGRSLTNGGYWHLLEDEPAIRETLW